MAYPTHKALMKNQSIKSKVIFRVSGLLTLAMLFITIVVALLIHQQMLEQMEVHLKSNGHDTHQRLEERIRFLVENSEVLSKNELLINAMLDAQGRETYLPTLAKNFMQGKDVVSLSIVDFDGRSIFKTQENIPRYATSPKLRSALAMGETDLYVQPSTNHIVVVVPIEYYSTTQGALVVVFDTHAIGENVIPHDLPVSLRFYENEKKIFEHFDFSDKRYHTTRIDPDIDTAPYLTKLNLSIEFGLLESVYIGPVKQALTPLAVIGLLFILLGLVLSWMLAEGITRPIVELYRRVTSSSGGNYVRCAPLGSGDELETLAEAFDERSLSLQFLAKHDPLTGLPNRLFFMDRLENALKHSQHDKNMLAIIFLDLDRFKEINDSLGHTIGDELLKKVANLLHQAIRDVDTVARLGGDEYAILIDDITDENIVIDCISDIMQRFKETMQINQFRFFISCSIGIALFPQNGSTPEELLKNADTAMYKAKDEGRDNYQFYTEDMTQTAYERMSLQNQLHSAISNQEFFLAYQPQVDMRDGTIVGMETLIRWNHPQKGTISPDRFIPIAEETGLIIEIDRWVMQTAMVQFASWIRKGFPVGKLSLNVSMLQLQHTDFIDVVAEFIRQSTIPPSQLEFEITETQIMRNPEEAIAMLHHFKTLGITLAIDDFGTGHSSLSYLKRLPIDKIKIDQSFIRGLPNDHDDIQLSRTIIAMAQNLNLDLIAEGVENVEQAQFLTEHGCYEAQGYLYFRPVSAAEIETIFSSKLNTP